MGEAKRRQAAKPTVVYHHTSTLCTNLIWMSGVIQVEGAQKKPVHPQLGLVDQSARFRRAMKTSHRLSGSRPREPVPKCLLGAKLLFQDKDTGAIIGELPQMEGVTDALSLTRMALGFNMSDIPVVPWADHYGYNSAEGRELNKTAREFGDCPTRWYVSEQPINMALLESIWTPRKGAENTAWNAMTATSWT